MMPEDPTRGPRDYAKDQFEEVQRGEERPTSVELLERDRRPEQAGSSGAMRVPDPGARPDAIRPEKPTEAQEDLAPEEDAVARTPAGSAETSVPLA
jgi:hypothetical protein